MMDVKEALKKGSTAEDLRKDFDAELIKAQQELEKETKTKADIQAKRQALIDATKGYFEALGFLSENDDKDADKALNSFLEEFEKRDIKITRFHPKNWDWWKNHWLDYWF